MPTEIVIPLVSLIIGIVGGIIGAYVGMKVGLVRLETWKEMAKDDIEQMQHTITLHDEDLLIHDMEIGMLMKGAQLARVRRQRQRD